MKCQSCNEADATVHFKEIKNDEVKELHLELTALELTAQAGRQTISPSSCGFETTPGNTVAASPSPKVV